MDIRSIGEWGVSIALSRRNLETLLAKLDGVPPNSACQIYCQQGVNGRVVALSIKAEEDVVHYNGRTPGVMHPATEEVLASKDHAGTG